MKEECADRSKMIKDITESIRKFKDEYLGVCYFSRTFGRGINSSRMTAIRVNNVTLNTDNCIFGNEPTVYDYNEVFELPNDHDRIALTFDYVRCDINRGTKDSCVSIGTKATNINSFYHPEHKISNAEFESIYDAAYSKVCETNYILSNEVDNNWDFSSFSFKRDDNNKVDMLKGKGERFIEIKDNRLLWLLQFHPFIYGKHILVSDLSKSLLKDEIDRCTKLRDESMHHGTPSIIGIAMSGVALLENLLTEMNDGH